SGTAAALPVTVRPGASARAVVQLDAAVAGPAVLARGRAHRTLLAVADHVQLAGGAAVGLQRGGDRVATALAQAEVVLAAAALVGIALEGQARGRTVTQVLGVAGHRGLEFRTQGVLVEVEVDGALAQAAVGIQVFRTVQAVVGDRLGDRRRRGVGDGRRFLDLL